MTSIRPADRRRRQPATRYQLVGGKGGVGKTTCAAALAIQAARSGLRTLAISTDPAPSLGDALAQPLGASPRRVPLGRHVLQAVEIDSRRALERWLAGRRESLARIGTRGTWLDAEDIARILKLALPGIDEIAALLEIERYGQSGHYDLIVVDTAPTGHTLRMLATPASLGRLADVFDAMQQKHRVIVQALRGRWSPDAEDAVIQDLDSAGRGLGALLSDASRLTATWIALPEPMAVAETQDGLSRLDSMGIHVSRVVVNRVTAPPPAPCRRCDAQRAFESRAVTALRRIPGAATLVAVAARAVEPRGVRALGVLGRELDAATTPVARRAAVKPWRAPIARAGRPVVAGLTGPATRLLMFGGKGGVGKTTCAAAAGLELASRHRARRVLLLSADPAHSLADALGVELSDEARRIPGGPPNLFVRELDAAGRFAQVRERYTAAVAAVFDRLARGSAADASHDRRVLTHLIDLTPPGIDELVAVTEVTDALDEGGAQERFDLVVMDMAPSGHALRLLETPAIVQDWARTLMSILLKYESVLGAGDLGAMLLGISKGLGRLRLLLEDGERSCFVAVTRAAALPQAETLRLVAGLSRMRIRVAAVLVNATGRGTCGRCTRELAAERREIAALSRRAARRGAKLIITPAEVPPPHGPAGLAEWARRWRDRPA